MTERIYPNPARPSKFEDRYRLYLDESGDHVFRETDELAHRYLCLLGCWFRNPDYLKFHESIESLKSEYLPHHPDDPVILHREDMINARKAFKNLRDAAVREKFDDALLRGLKWDRKDRLKGLAHAKQCERSDPLAREAGRGRAVISHRPTIKYRPDPHVYSCLCSCLCSCLDPHVYLSQIAAPLDIRYTTAANFGAPIPPQEVT